MKHKLQNLLEVPGGSPHTRQAFEHTPLQAVEGLPSESLLSEEWMDTSALLEKQRKLTKMCF